jgi:hypothetical protein
VHAAYESWLRTALFGIPVVSSVDTARSGWRSRDPASGRDPERRAALFPNSARLINVDASQQYGPVVALRADRTADRSGRVVTTSRRRGGNRSPTTGHPSTLYSPRPAGIDSATAHTGAGSPARPPGRTHTEPPWASRYSSLWPVSTNIECRSGAPRHTEVTSVCGTGSSAMRRPSADAPPRRRHQRWPHRAAPIALPTAARQPCFHPAVACPITSLSW